MSEPSAIVAVLVCVFLFPPTFPYLLAPSVSPFSLLPSVFDFLVPPASGALAATRPTSSIWGFLVPGAIFAISFAVTWALYRRFAGKSK